MIQFQKAVQKQFNKMMETGKLYKSVISGDSIWELYLSSFKDGDDPVFRDPESSTHNCNHCKNFFRRYGNIVAITEDNTLMTIFDVNSFEIEEEFVQPANRLNLKLKNAQVQDIFLETFEELNSLPYEKCSIHNFSFRLGIDKNHKRYTREEAQKFGGVKANQVKTFNHLFLDIDETFVDKTGKSITSIKSDYRTRKILFERTLNEISLDSLELVRDLIRQDSILDGATHINKVLEMIQAHQDFNMTLFSNSNEKDNWIWKKSRDLSYPRFKNELIGTLCMDISNGVDINEACKTWNKRVDPANYMKAKAPITKLQIERAAKFVEDNGYQESFHRKLATIDDILVTEIKHMNVDNGGNKSLNIFSDIKPTKTSNKSLNFDNIEEVSIEKFMSEILPECSLVQAYFENRHQGNLVSLTTSVNKDSKRIFKWDNNYSWTYKGNLAGKSMLKQAVKDAGGNVEGVIRCSLAWNHSSTDASDLDLWCKEPENVRIGFDTPFRKDKSNGKSPSKGQLDLDIINPGKKVAIENIYFKEIESLREGKYKFWVNQYAANNSQGFQAEIEVDGNIYKYEFNKPVPQSAKMTIAEVTYKNGVFSIKHILPCVGESSKTFYSLDTNQFHKVNLISLSPNHWKNNNYGNKHYFFMLDDCKIDESIRSFHNENLINDLRLHRKVLEVLGNQTLIEQDSDKGLSGLGFNATVRDELILKLESHKTFNKLIKVKF